MEPIGVCLSGGGHRASLFGLGVLLYLARAKTDDGTPLKASVQAISSVSGGSLTNAFFAQSLDYQSATEKQVESVAAALASQIAKRGTFFALWGTRVYVCLLILLGVMGLLGIGAELVLRMFGDTQGLSLGAIGLVSLLALGALLQARSRVCEWAFAKTLFTDACGRPTRLKHLARPITHILCATEVQTGQAVWFTSQGAFCKGFKPSGDLANFPVARAVQASAAFPLAFPPRRIRARLTEAFARAWPSRRRKPTHMVIFDGGVRDNLGVDVFLRWTEDTGSAIRLGDYSPYIQDVIVVSGAANRVKQSLLRAEFPFLGELSALKKISDLPYNTREANSRRALEWRFRAAVHLERAGWPKQRGTLLHIEESPAELAREIKLWLEDWHWQSTPPGERDELAHPYGMTRLMESALGQDAPPARWVTQFMGWSEMREAADRAERVLEALWRAENLNDRGRVWSLWAERAKHNAAVRTHFSRLATDVAARLMWHGFALAMARLHILWNYPLVDMPSVDFFERLARDTDFSVS